MTNAEFEAMRNERTEELTQALIRNNMKIANIVRNAYERGFADGVVQIEANGATDAIDLWNMRKEKENDNK